MTTLTQFDENDRISAHHPRTNAISNFAVLSSLGVSLDHEEALEYPQVFLVDTASNASHYMPKHPMISHSRCVRLLDVAPSSAAESGRYEGFGRSFFGLLERPEVHWLNDVLTAHRATTPNHRRDFAITLLRSAAALGLARPNVVERRSGVAIEFETDERQAFVLLRDDNCYLSSFGPSSELSASFELSVRKSFSAAMAHVNAELSSLA